MTAQSHNKIRLSTIYSQHFQDYLRSKDRKLPIVDKHIKAVNKAMSCRTSTLGLAVYSCEECGEEVHIHRSCKHRFCSRCGAADTMKWAEKTLRSLMNIKHHHVIVTLPKAFRFISKLNGDQIYNLLFKKSAEAIQEWFRIKHNLRCGIVSVLHTAGSDLKYHPHVHMILSAGGQELTDSGFKVLKDNYLTRQQFLGKKISKIFTTQLIKNHAKGILKVSEKLQDGLEFKKWLARVNSKPWVVSIQPALEDINQIVGYVGRYSKRSCLSEYKIERADEVIRFRYNDYKNTPRGEKPRIGIKQMQLIEFLDSLLQHVPATGFKMVRYYGLYNSMYKWSIPYEMRYHGELEGEYLFDEDMDWGEYEVLRKTMIKLGKPDPLYCLCCRRSMKFQQFRYEKSFKAFEYDSS
ncbi:IS91 family transposase [Portibacter marinus]|uniref:IS91 family transposase n=1 Tax=Portibacter marinus TaxID=2898660 RepID=UPI001F30C8C0|nr:transposase [Portibacter marinus]